VTRAGGGGAAGSVAEAAHPSLLHFASLGPRLPPYLAYNLTGPQSILHQQRDQGIVACVHVRARDSDRTRFRSALRRPVVLATALSASSAHDGCLTTRTPHWRCFQR